jgi:hypothetical protein
MSVKPHASRTSKYTQATGNDATPSKMTFPIADLQRQALSFEFVNGSAVNGQWLPSAVDALAPSR